MKKLLMLAVTFPLCSFAQSEMTLAKVPKCEAWKLTKVDVHQSVDAEWHEAGDGTWFTNSVGEKISVERYCADVLQRQGVDSFC